MYSSRNGTTGLLEYSPTFEKIRSRRGFRDEMIEPERITPETKSRLVLPYIRRQVIHPDAVTVKTILGENMGNLPQSIEPRGTLGVTHISPSVALNLYNNCFDSGRPFNDQRRFSKRVNQVMKKCNEAHTRIFAQLGEIGVYGNIGDPDKKKFIAAEIVKGSDEDVLMGELELYLDNLIQGNDEMKRRYYDEGTMHLSLAYTYSYDDALIAAHHLGAEELLKDKWIAFGQAHIKTEAWD